MRNLILAAATADHTMIFDNSRLLRSFRKYVELNRLRLSADPAMRTLDMAQNIAANRRKISILSAMPLFPQWIKAFLAKFSTNDEHLAAFVIGVPPFADL